MADPMQSKADRERRLSECRCPVHGTGMAQVGLQGELFLVTCPRRACGIRGTSIDCAGPVTLLPEFEHLLT